MEDGPGPAAALPVVVVVEVLRLGEAELGSGDRRKARSSPPCDSMMGRSARPGVYGLHRGSL